MTLADFHATVDALLGEKGALDAEIPIAVRLAARKLERGFNFRYMREEVTKDYPASNPPTTVDLGARVKSVISGEVREDGGWEGIQEIVLLESPHVLLDSQALEDKFPIWVKNEKLLLPLLATTVAYDLHFLIYRRSDWPLSSYGAFSHYLVDDAEDLLLAETMLNLAPVGRDADLVQYYQNLRNESVRTLTTSGFIVAHEDY
jgi:hypothetical protein